MSDNDAELVPCPLGGGIPLGFQKLAGYLEGFFIIFPVEMKVCELDGGIVPFVSGDSFHVNDVLIDFARRVKIGLGRSGVIVVSCKDDIAFFDHEIYFASGRHSRKSDGFFQTVERFLLFSRLQKHVGKFHGNIDLVIDVCRRMLQHTAQLHNGLHVILVPLVCLGKFLERRNFLFRLLFRHLQIGLPEGGGDFLVQINGVVFPLV